MNLIGPIIFSPPSPVGTDGFHEKEQLQLRVQNDEIVAGETI